jgi:hypothetical protein
MMILTTVALAFIVAAWAVQLTHVYQGHKDFHKFFLQIYIIGVALLTIAGRGNGLDINAILNISSAILATLIFIKLKK